MLRHTRLVVHLLECYSKSIEAISYVPLSMSAAGILTALKDRLRLLFAVWLPHMGYIRVNWLSMGRDFDG